MSSVLPSAILLLVLASTISSVCANEPSLTVARLPPGAIQPSVATTPEGVTTVAFLQGDPKACDVALATLTAQLTLSPARVLTKPESQAVGLGTVRGPSLALGKDGVPHVLWTGKAGTASDAKGSALFYSHGATSHQVTPPRDMMDTTFGLGGGAAIAADPSGNVWIAWHGLTPGSKGETSRRVFLRHSSDNGATFTAPFPIQGETFGACACCGLAASIDRAGQLHILYRTARATTHRGIRALTLPVNATPETTPAVLTQDEWSLGACPMTTSEWSPTEPSVAWVNAFQIKLFGPDLAQIQSQLPTAAASANHPRLVRNSHGETLLLWTEGAGWAKAGQLICRVWRPGVGFIGSEPPHPLPVWSYGAACTSKEGRFVVIY